MGPRRTIRATARAGRRNASDRPGTRRRGVRAPHAGRSGTGPQTGVCDFAIRTCGVLSKSSTKRPTMQSHNNHVRRSRRSHFCEATRVIANLTQHGQVSGRIPRPRRVVGMSRGSVVFEGATAGAAAPCPSGTTSAQSASAATTDPLEDINPSLVDTVYDASEVSFPPTLADLLHGLTSPLPRRLRWAVVLRRPLMTD